MYWIIGTAGHIDHGKTSLIRALTGQDTDRLKEEKERGISIDLGFAHLDLPDGTRAGIVDVPGHERFVRNMLAGAHGIDLVLFAVAADDGVMPQTEEHLDILHLLGVERAIFVITKTDLVSAPRVREVCDEVRALIEGTILDGSPLIPVSTTTEAGLRALRDAIFETLRTGSKQPRDGYFRLLVDRAFVSAGHGLVVTGTGVSGEIGLDDKVRCLPSGELFRIRDIQVHGASVERGTWGQRIALNLSGSGHADIVRGDVICDERITLTCDRFDARVEVRPTTTAGIKSHQKVRVHLGTAERMGKVIVFGEANEARVEHIRPNQAAYCQISLTAPLHTLRGDRFILRDETAQRTLGGGVVIHPGALKHKRDDVALVSRLEKLDRGDDPLRVTTLIEESGEFVLPLSRIAQLLNRREDDVRARLDSMNIVHIFGVDGDVLCGTKLASEQVKEVVLEALRAHHASHPLSPGMDIEEARAGVRAQVPAKIFRILIQELDAGQELTREGNLLRLRGHRSQIPDAQLNTARRIQELLGRTPLGPPDLKQLSVDIGLDRRRLIELVRAMERESTVVAVAPDMYFLSDAVARVRTDLVSLLAVKGEITAAEFRDRYRTTRKFAIPLLEYFDREGVTIRVGEVRRLKRTSVKESA